MRAMIEELKQDLNVAEEHQSSGDHQNQKARKSKSKRKDQKKDPTGKN